MGPFGGSPPGGSMWLRCSWRQQEPPLVRERAQFSLKVEGGAREDQLISGSNGSEVTQSPVQLSGVPGMPGPPGSHFLPLPSRHWQGWGRGQSTPARGQHQGVGAHDLWSQAEIHFAECIDLPFHYFLDFGTPTSNPPPLTPHTRSCIRSSSSHYPFGFAAACGRALGEDLAHASPPPLCHLKGSSFGFLLSG